MKLRAVDPVGERISSAFVRRASGCTFKDVTIPTYPPSPMGDKLREARHRASLSLGQAARLFGLKASEFSGLEWGRTTLDNDDWQAVFRALNAIKGRA